ncbi:MULTISPECIES: carbohydrate ABC transporter permease [Cryobacterium]|uniref:Sugar ABC transporter permease n=1 Tax=Cryobacterium zongtaii TaxID=1259217 RepID=A0A2S3ZAV1_9MICO|nr:MULTISPECIES: sugar ABC transporter permease [Cryobacterium]ASD22894.1 ABC transporter permease [Cryobacterium sp. LW097]POH62676.1 sugar ABC transporter permease [Cryobacterium zongtaii]POH69873.1 sugar ABC transporter permease [Cryobacterium zongtaii]TFC42890.1 sugar ABC transporter permease [Cryobacterium sp. TMN-39-2]TFC50285.1 sugar ABC transporter permease [Cryobacterium sp. TMB3-1-2]
MSAPALPAADARRAGSRSPAPRPRKIKVSHPGAIAIFIVPFAILFTLFYLLPIGYAIYQSLLVVERDGTFGKATEVFGGLTQYILVFQNGPFWESITRVLAFGVVQVPVMLGLALLFALLLDSPLLRGKRFFRLAFFVPYAVPGVIAAIMWGFLYSPNLSPFTALTSNVSFLSADLVLWAIANVVTWVYVGYNMLIIYSALLAIPTEIYEAARLDGAGQLRIAWSIKIPLIMPAIVLTGIFSIIGTLQLLAEPQVFRSFSSAVTSTFTPNLMVYSTSSIPNVNLAAAFSVVLALATFVLSFSFLKFTQRKEGK